MKQRLLEEGDELGLDWDRWSDGRPWRLKRKRHLKGKTFPVVREAARNAAVRRGKVVQTLSYIGYVWVQFSDYRINLGDPCPCGGRELEQVGKLFVRCRTCHAQLELQRTSLFDGDESSPLDAFSNIHLQYLEESDGADVYRGYGDDGGGQPVLLFVEFKRPKANAPQTPLTAETAGTRLRSLRAVPFAELAGIADTDSLVERRDDSWDLVL